MTRYYELLTRYGTFRIEQTPLGWVPFFDDKALGGPYRTAQIAMDDLAEGHTDWPSCGNPAMLGASSDSEDWEYCVA